MAALGWSLGAHAGARDSAFNPGLMGPNAVPTIPGDSPWPGTHVRSGIGVAVQRAWTLAGGPDLSLTVPLYLSVPIGSRVALLADGAALEASWVSPGSASGWGLTQADNVVQADTRLGAKFLLVADPDWPAVALRLVVKTTTGKGRPLRRFLDAPGYQIDLPFAKQWRLPRRVTLELGGAIGFFAWQQPDYAQNDAYTYFARAALTGPRWQAGLELRGFVGWQRHDRPITVELFASLALHRLFAVTLSALANLQDPAMQQVALGLRTALPSPFVAPVKQPAEALPSLGR